jgi:hypothetical protein
MARRFMSNPMVQTEMLCSMAKATTMAYIVSTPQMSVVSNSYVEYCLIVCIYRTKREAQAWVAKTMNIKPMNQSRLLMSAPGIVAGASPWTG